MIEISPGLEDRRAVAIGNGTTPLAFDANEELDAAFGRGDAFCVTFFHCEDFARVVVSSGPVKRAASMPSICQSVGCGGSWR